MAIRLLSVNRSGSRTIDLGGKATRTGIYKEPVEEPVHVGRLGLDGDVQVHKQHHGGPDQALYAYSAGDYDWFAAELGRPLPPGTFGENLTLSDFGRGPLSIGDRFRIGPVLLEVTAPRIPCNIFATRMGDPRFVRRFISAERPGAYVRVLEEGRLAAGMPVVREPGTASRKGAPVGLIEVFRAYYDSDLDPQKARRILAAPIADRARPRFERRLSEAAARPVGARQ